MYILLEKVAYFICLREDSVCIFFSQLADSETRMNKNDHYSKSIKLNKN